jgi:YfiH family protein
MTIVRSTLLTQFPEIVFGMSTREGGVSPGKLGLNMSFRVGDNPENVLENRKRFLTYLGIDQQKVAYPQQEHTNNVQICSIAAKYDHCDALVSKESNLFLAISIADCTPVILFDKSKKVIAAIHAGWRGTVQQITKIAVSKMVEEFGCNAKEIVAFIGPSASKCCYEVGEDVAQQFPKECLERKQNGKYLLDVKKANQIQLLHYGIEKDNIEIHNDCTISNELYHSYRRDGNESGRMLAVVGIKIRKYLCVE